MHHQQALDYLVKIEDEMVDMRRGIEIHFPRVPRMFHQDLPFSHLMPIGQPLIRAWLDFMAAVIQAEAIDVQQQFRQARAEHQKEHRKGKSWTHDVRLKNTPNGVTVEWFSYTGKYGEFHFSKGIRSGGSVRVPARAFKNCSLIEKNAISEAEDNFSHLRHATMWLSTLSKALNALLQSQNAKNLRDLDNKYKE
ncbi:conjugative transfer protein MobI(A/C) [Pseudomonas sp.]|jgi:hypothetical protein|uniref:conjugative transfer protein MobI(A/C) n=1 Tax=Pseudomonas sp. TaxID=306 RepID=UPI001A027196|nr:conjugative transfer protein MobI(A/C) [Pseudomonas sp.]MBF0675113.1 hypothetical protein [Pseudomonas sp.]MBF0677005.1 hypothetical protein [Pseudomonas sp.]